MRVRVTTNHRLDPSKQLGPSYTTPERKSISWNDSSDRKWLMNHLHHCMHNNKVVTLIPESN